MIALSDVGQCSAVGSGRSVWLTGGQNSERSTIMIKVHFAGNV